MLKPSCPAKSLYRTPAGGSKPTPHPSRSHRSHRRACGVRAVDGASRRALARVCRGAFGASFRAPPRLASAPPSATYDHAPASATYGPAAPAGAPCSALAPEQPAPVPASSRAPSACHADGASARSTIVRRVCTPPVLVTARRGRLVASACPPPLGLIGSQLLSHAPFSLDGLVKLCLALACLSIALPCVSVKREPHSPSLARSCVRALPRAVLSSAPPSESSTSHQKPSEAIRFPTIFRDLPRSSTIPLTSSARSPHERDVLEGCGLSPSRRRRLGCRLSTRRRAMRLSRSRREEAADAPHSRTSRRQARRPSQ